ncbi:hypothetical protein PHMEG_0007058 [Phytophthora megakarya]|uniref:Uncharacterized protein n=1 Tax=Phytophthora megakarya TaxID=4795 RepID=A0A225WNF2_9STRA|nr:hypothetical protein PHMEG_0007058 [Phytophthora megakarya]
MPTFKIAKVVHTVRNAIQSNALRRFEYRSLLGCLRHMATCIRPARAFLQRLREHERGLHRWRAVPVTANMREDLLWRLYMLNALSMNGVHLSYFNTLPTLDIVIEMDASDSGSCAIFRTERTAHTYVFSSMEQNFIRESKNNPTIGFNINYREPLTMRLCGAHKRHILGCSQPGSAVSWQNKTVSKNSRAQTAIRLLSLWETE